MNKYKIDIFAKNNSNLNADDVSYFGSILIETELSRCSVVKFLQNHGGDISAEGIEIKTFELDDYTLMTITDFVRDGYVYTDLIYRNQDYQTFKQPLQEKTTALLEDFEYLIIKLESLEVVNGAGKAVILLENNAQKVIRYHYQYEWGCSAFFENLLVNVTANLTSSIIEKLYNLGLKADNVERYVLPIKIKKSLASLYKINPDTLFLESYIKDQEIIKVNFRNVSYHFSLQITDGELVALRAEKLDKLI